MYAISNLAVNRTLRAIQSLMSHFRRARRQRMAAGLRAIWTLNVTMMLAAVVLFKVGAGDASPPISSMHVPFWALLIGFAAAERFVVHVHFRHSAHSMSLGEIPLVLGLLFASGHDVILAGAIGRIAVLALHRRLPPIRLAFNFGSFLLGNCIAVLTFHAVATPSVAINPGLWAAALLATAATSLTTAFLITVVVSLSEGRLSPRQVARTLGTDLAVAATNTSIALCAATLVFDNPMAAILMVVPIAAMFAVFHAYLHERERHERLEFLYKAARTLSQAPEIGSAIEGLLAQALEAFRAEVAELIFFSPNGSAALRTTVRATGPAHVLEAIEPGIAEELRSLIERRGLGAAPVTEIADGGLAGYLESRDLSDGLFAVLKGERTWIGAMMLGNPSGVVHTFSPDDVKLFEALANNTSVALENDRLGQAVWQLKELQQELEYQASHDPLTDLANRSLFVERVGDALHSGAGSVSVIFIDIDDFKTVNDSLGHAAGDELLVSLSQRLSECVRPSDVVARLGGDEFAIMLAGISSQDEAIEVAERVIRRLGEPFDIGRQNIAVRVSAGIATGARNTLTPNALIRNADVAMYRVKQSGKHGYELYESGMEVPVLRRHGIKQRLREAVQKESFVVHYQPIVELETGTVAASEALVRWLDGPRGPVKPHSFIPIAEEMGVIVPIGRSVLRRACGDAQRWGRGEPSGPAVHVNVSPVELRHRGFVAGVAEALEQSGLDPGRLVLEVTEGVVLHDPAKSITTLNELRALGVQLALDDFGTGYSSLSHLRSLPIDWLKIGKPFVDGLGQEGFDRPFVRMILELAASMGVDVVAEGIESGDQLAVLRELGCGYGQGFYLGTPAELLPRGVAPRLNPIADFERELRAALV
jgi:diguanylate cyclase (GGDEF)-like protein